MNAMVHTHGDEMETTYAVDFGRTREPVATKRSRHPDYRRSGSAPSRVNGMHCRRNKRWTWGSGRGARMTNLRAFASCVALFVASLAVTSQAATVFETVGDPGNPAQSSGVNTGLGSVAYTFQMGATEVTTTEYAAFLNSAAKSDPNALYNSAMTGIGISRTGSSGNFTYNVTPSLANRPIAYVSYFDAARYVNWLTSGNTESGTYTITGTGSSTVVGARNPNPTSTMFVLPNQNEWYKAAFYNATLSTYSTWQVAGTQPGVTPVAGQPVGTTRTVNMNNVRSQSANVGAYALNETFYGMFDMLGNVAEWSENQSGANARVWSGSYGNAINASQWGSSSQQFRARTYEAVGQGFRVGQIAAVPEPSTYALAGLGIVGLGGANWMKRRRRTAASAAIAA